MKKLLIFYSLGIAFMLLSPSISAQIDQFVIGALGGEISGGQVSLIHSIGDLVGSSQGNDPHLTQGFVDCFKSDTDNCTQTSIEKIYEHPLIQIFPNPTERFIRLKGNPSLIDRFELFNSTGQSVLGGTIQGDQISLYGLPAGMYLVRIYGRKGELTLIGKIMKV